MLLGRASIEESLRRGARRLGRSAVFSTLGATLSALSVGVLAIPAAPAARIAWTQLNNRIAMGEFLQMKTEEIRMLT